MITLQITQDQKDYARNLAKEVYEEHLANPNKKLKFFTKDPIEALYKGFLGETIFADYYKLSRPINHHGADEGYDFVVGSKKIDVKSYTWIGNNLYLKLEDKDWGKPSTHFALVQIANDLGVIHGILSKEEVRVKGFVEDYGHNGGKWSCFCGCFREFRVGSLDFFG